MLYRFTLPLTSACPRVSYNFCHAIKTQGVTHFSPKTRTPHRRGSGRMEKLFLIILPFHLSGTTKGTFEGYFVKSVWHGKPEPTPQHDFKLIREKHPGFNPFLRSLARDLKVIGKHSGQSWRIGGHSGVRGRIILRRNLILGKISLSQNRNLAGRVRHQRQTGDADGRLLSSVCATRRIMLIHGRSSESYLAGFHQEEHEACRMSQFIQCRAILIAVQTVLN